MSERNDGGPAFPPMHNPENHPSGLSMRDWFAGQAHIADTRFPDATAMCAFVGEKEPWVGDPDYFDRMIVISAKTQAKLRYAIADAMLAERSRS